MSKSKKSPAASREGQDAAAPRNEGSASKNGTDKPYRSKVHAVELALEKLGWDAMPADIREHLLNKFDLDMSPAHIGVNKTSILRRLGMLPPKGESRVRVKKSGGTGKGPRASAARSAETASFTSDDIRKVKALLGTYDQEAVLTVAAVVEEVGAGKFRELVEAFC